MAPRRYPVLYLHDGQNLFDPTTSFIPNQEWRVDRTVQSLLSLSLIEPIIVVGIYNTGHSRIEEYTPTPDLRLNKGGRAGLYERLLVEELKPYVDSLYKTQSGPEHTGLGGSSLGGLVSLHIGLKRSDVFGKLAVMSPSIWWDRMRIVREVEALASKPATRIWLDMGTREGRNFTAHVRALRDALVEKGWDLGEDLAYHEARNARHNELAWARRVAPMLKFLFPASRTSRQSSGSRAS